MKPILFLFCIFATNHVCCSYQGDSWQWAWRCGAFGKCVKYSQSSGSAKYAGDAELSDFPSEVTSQDVCRLTCGKYGALWPVPTISTQISTKTIRFHPRDINVQISENSNEVTDFIREASKIFTNNLYLECGENCSIFPENPVTISVIITSKVTTIAPAVDESYSLDISTNDNQVRIEIQADTIFGGRHAFETLTQLVASYQIRDPDMAKSGLVMVAEAKIKDKPTYQYRGLLLDTARNYLTVEAIKRQIDAMAASKMNVLHWHATDSQSFPIQFKRVPQLARFGAYSSKKMYNVSDIQHLKEYGKLRGVRLVLEIDAPSHAGNGWQWGPAVGYGNLAVCINKQPWRSYCIQPPCGQLNPTNEKIYKVLGDIFKDVVEMFNPGEYFHMGGDEVFIPCWNSTEEIIAYMDSHFHGRTMDDFLQLWSDFQKNSLQAYDEAVGSSNGSVILWSSHLTNADVIEKYLSKDRYIIETWVPASNELPYRLLDLGYRLIISTKDAWYLDHGFWGNTQYHSWRVAYKNKLPRHKLVLGGEVCMWGELVDDSSVDSRVWPRAAAAAERLWSDPEFGTAAVETRFYRHRERLRKRGVEADALAPGWCYQNEEQCQ